MTVLPSEAESGWGFCGGGGEGGGHPLGRTRDVATPGQEGKKRSQNKCHTKAIWRRAAGTDVFKVQKQTMHLRPQGNCVC